MVTKLIFLVLLGINCSHLSWREKEQVLKRKYKVFQNTAFPLGAERYLRLLSKSLKSFFFPPSVKMAKMVQLGLLWNMSGNEGRLLLKDCLKVTGQCDLSP